ncbi:MAG: hypothetical protein IJZ15_01535 [Oscillospiraceae bacterium]|nr:hypothetical protein [Oscillospiraceae bacterium]
MDDERKELQPEADDAFSLEDILKEFGDPSKPFEPEADVLIWDGTIPTESAQNVAFPSDTIRMGDITRAVRELSEASDTEQTMRFAPVGGEEEEEPKPLIYQPVDEPPRAEPYSEEWEPEYEQPISEYVPQEPIVFRPKSRLHELKHKLVEGPEKRYYQLSEMGLGKLQVAILINVVIFALAAGAAVLYTLDMVSAERMRLLVFGQFLALMLSALLGSYQLIEGVADLLHKRFTLNTLLVFSAIACAADAVLCLQVGRVPCCAAFCLNMTMSLWSAYQKRSTEISQMDTMRKATRLDSLVSTPDYYEGLPGVLRGEGQVEDFMDNYNAPAGAEKIFSIYALAALAASLVSGAVGVILGSVHMGVQVLCTSLLVATPATMFITLSRPMALLQRRLHKHGSVICGWKGVLGLSKALAFPLKDTDLFPMGAAKMNGVKFYGSRNPDEVVAYATALINADGGTMALLFQQLLDSRSGYHYEAENVRSYDGGIGGEVQGEAVLAGTLAFMQSMGVEMPEGTRVSSAVYVAIDGALSGVFAITYSKVKTSAVGLNTLCAYRGLIPVLTTNDFMLSDSFIRSRFGVNVKRMAFPEREVRDALSQRQPEEDAPALALTTRDGLAGMAYAVTGSRALRSATMVGAAIHLIAGILGLVIMLVLTIIGAQDLLTPTNILLYELIWMIPGLLVTQWTRLV